jgi:hypothetical protein
VIKKTLDVVELRSVFNCSTATPSESKWRRWRRWGRVFGVLHKLPLDE